MSLVGKRHILDKRFLIETYEAYLWDEVLNDLFIRTTSDLQHMKIHLNRKYYKINLAY